jgi:kynurenine formamidase
MKIIDLSQPMYDHCPNCPVHPAVKVELIGSHAKDGPDGWHMEHLSMASHTGSHIDAPLHKIQGGKSLDRYPLEKFAGPAWLADLRGIAAGTPITAEMLAGRLAGKKLAGHNVLLATGWGDKRAADKLWHDDSPFLEVSGARWLVDAGVNLIGIDHYSIGGCREPNNARVHETLLSHHVLIVEDLHLADEALAAPQPAEFMALPIHFRGFSGAFCRPVLIVR